MLFWFLHGYLIVKPTFLINFISIFDLKIKKITYFFFKKKSLVFFFDEVDEAKKEYWIDKSWQIKRSWKYQDKKLDFQIKFDW